MSDVKNAYARALYDLAREAGVSERVLEETRGISEALKSEPRYTRLLSSHEISKQERCGLIDECFSRQVHEYVLSTMKLMTEHGHIRLFEAMSEEYAELYNEDHGILAVNVFSKTELTEAQKQKLAARLDEITQKKTVLSFRRDENCIGGIRLEYAGLSVDDTLRHRLENLGRQLKGAAV